MGIKVKPSSRTHMPAKDYKRAKPDMTAPPSRQWFAVICNVNAEKKARNGLQGKFMTYLPVTVRKQLVGGRRGLEAIYERALFPRYLFVASREQAFRFYDLAGVNGVESIVRCEGRPMPIPHSIIEAMMRREIAGEFVAPGVEKEITLEDLGLSTGDRVTLTNGAFTGIVGIIQALMPKAQARIMLEILGGAVPVTMPVADLEKVA